MTSVDTAAAKSIITDDETSGAAEGSQSEEAQRSEAQRAEARGLKGRDGDEVLGDGAASPPAH